MKKLALLLILFSGSIQAQEIYQPNRRPAPAGVEVARGGIPGVGSINKFGRSSDVDAVLTDIWDGANTSDNIVTIASHTVAWTGKIYSTSAEDTDGGIGCQRVLIEGIDYDFERSSESVIMNGTALVLSATTYIGIDRIMCQQAGNNSTSSGNIFVGAVLADTTQAMVTNGTDLNNQSLMAITYIPKDQEAYITSYFADVNKATGSSAFVDVQLVVRENMDIANTPFKTRHYTSVTSAGTSHIPPHVFDPPLKVVGPATIKVRGLGSGVNLDVSAGFDCITLKVR